MIHGAHVVLSSTKPEADRAFFREVLRLPSVDVGDGWLIFALPPSELAVHPAGKNDEHELYLMCEDVEAFVKDLARRGVACSPVQSVGWGILTRLTLPGGGTVGVYQPRHARPKAAAVRRRRRASRPAVKRRRPSARARARR